jgi:hypothetical protein
MLAASSSLPEDEFEAYGGVQQVDLPHTVKGGVTVEYGLPPEDGHFAVFHNTDAIRHYTNFLGTAALDENPTVVK